jgi:hypothetical protein
MLRRGVILSISPRLLRLELMARQGMFSFDKRLIGLSFCIMTISFLLLLLLLLLRLLLLLLLLLCPTLPLASSLFMVTVGCLRAQSRGVHIRKGGINSKRFLFVWFW